MPLQRHAGPPLLAPALAYVALMVAGGYVEHRLPRAT